MDNNVLKTLCYFSVFNFPLTKEELARFCHPETLAKDLDDVIEEDGYFGLGDPATWVDRKARELTSLKKIDAAKKLFKKISWWPYLKAVLVTGSVVAMNAEDRSDVDVLVISTKDSLWLTRLVIVTFLILTGSYRKFICPNIWISEDSLEWPDKNIHSACDLILARPIINKDETYERFLEANAWVSEFWAFNTVEPPHGAALPETGAVVRGLNLLLFKLENLRRLAFNIKTADEITYNRIQYKKNDSKGWILAKYQANLDLFTNM